MQNGEIIILKGDWPQDQIELFAKEFERTHPKMYAILLILAEGQGIESMGIAEFYRTMKECEKRLGLAPPPVQDEVSGD